MATNSSPEIDDELFNEVYGKEYTGPPRLTFNDATMRGKSIKNSNADQSDEEEPIDPNAVPTDFTSREAKVWEAKAKATERNWKKRKEEEMICKLCGESGHFTQGCPSTLGGNRKSADFFERVPARDKQVRALFSQKMISQIEKDIGCKIKMDEKFLIVSGKDRLILSKGVDAVHKVIQDDKGKSGSPSSSKRTRSRSPEQSPVGSRLRRSESQKYNSSPKETPRHQSKGFNQERVIENDVQEDLHQFSRGPPHARAYANEGAKGRTARSRSPLRPTLCGESFSPYDGHNETTGIHLTNNWNMERRGTESRSEHKSNFPSYPQTLEELEMEYKREAMELGRVRDKEEDEEIYKHRECIRELRENFMKKLAIMRGMQAKQRDEFLQTDIQRRQQAQENPYNQHPYSDYDQPSRNTHNAGPGLDPRGGYPYPSENYSGPRPLDSYSEFHHQRKDDFGKTYGRY